MIIYHSDDTRKPLDSMDGSPRIIDNNFGCVEEWTSRHAVVAIIRTNGGEVE